ncbi:phosphate signaling complex protein PhoU [Suipraeoptans intestinalis]|uniref:Phosphate-specific transport system accessory protein PhoU n=1 Tax=Suipraeoptans intestinalis TaxID=2606628 RepID=A0A6N7URL9_9FIRM|nr:phosphate signaling complex protein PhoU [Suipraeoptans intestinalis]MDD7770361.1 phosphate signaling complex protein PhoU [Suipraeoptans intestinalis]MDY3121330.1 phosphate signaling complex protein PhoU [Suipraeoptans intestinalis]MSR93381.1 phosphate signaling complex protein PhoU [Suipraeoptans intestinalis]
MRDRFGMQLKYLNEQLTDMGDLCGFAIDKAVCALWEGDYRQGRKAMELDEEISQMEKDIERLCLKLLLQQQPVARDLRQISAALKMVTDMSRIGNQAADIGEIILSGQFTGAVDVEGIREMAKKAAKMVNDSVRAYVTKDLELSRRVMEADDEVDELFTRNRERLVELIAEERGENGEFAVDLLMIIKYLERIADHAVNISAWVEFSITGVHRNPNG